MHVTEGAGARFFIAVTLFVSLSAGAVPRTAHHDGIEGHYAGTMDLAFDRARKINLEVTIARTGETELLQKGPNEFEERQVIDSAFVVDDEGGPFAFTKVTYNIEKGEIDLRYSRRSLTTVKGPADFRLVGIFQADGSIAGRVHSGIRGPIGTFTLAPSNKVTLDTVKKYDGRWAGTAAIYPMGPRRSIEIVISAGLSEVIDPPDYEFGFTPGKMADFVFDNVKFSFNSVVVDYLRQRIFLSQIDAEGRNMLTAELDADFGEHSYLRGSLYGAYKGKSADLGLRKIN